MILAASVSRTDIANYVGAVFYVYILLLFIYILINMMFSLGVRPPYSTWTDAVLNFFRDVSEPYLRLYRNLIQQVGMFDFSPMIAIIVLYIARTIIVNLIAGT